VISSPLSALPIANKKATTPYGFLLVVIGVIAIFASSIFTISLSPLSLPPNQLSAFATFPGENGKITFDSNRDGGNYDIYVMNADGSEQTRLTTDPGIDEDPNWSPDGTKIAFNSIRDGNREIYVMNADGSEQTRLTTDPGSDDGPDWSPDGTKIAFRSDRDGLAEIYVMNADGSNPIRLTNNDASDVLPAWSPDGTKIAFASNRNGDIAEIYVMNADGSEQTRLTNNPAIDTTPDWSPDGEKIVFRRNLESQNPEIYIMNAADGTEQINISNNPAIDFDPSWSPDGTKIAFTSYRLGFSEIFVMNAADGTEQINISNNRGSADGHPDWGKATTLEDTIPPVITVPEDITEEATSPDGAEVSFEVSAEDDVDGAVDVSCDYNSGGTFPIGETVVTCSAEDAAGNIAEESFTVTVQDTIDPDVEITEAVDRRRNTEIPDGGATPIPYIQITFEATDAVGIDETECSLDGQQTFTPCTSPVVYDRLSRGTHEVTVRATDEAGNAGEDEFTWTVGNNLSAATAPGRQ
jgi:Tol biopolymer transport system component